MKLLLIGLNYSPEEIGIGKYSGEMIEFLSSAGFAASVVTAPPYYPQWRVWSNYSAWRYSTSVESNGAKVTRCPIYVPRRVTGLRRIIHLASFGLSAFPAAIIRAITERPEWVFTVEPTFFSLPTAWLAAKIGGSKCWLHVQDFEVDAAFELGLIKLPFLRHIISALEAFWMRRFDIVSSISPKMMEKLTEKGVSPDRVRSLPNWVDTDVMRPLENPSRFRNQFGIPVDKTIVLYAGNVGKKQGLDLLIQAAEACAENSSIHFVICGQGAAIEEISKLAESVPNVQLLPLQPMEKFNELMNCADIHVLPQKADAADLVMPSKLTGMLATGRAIIACASEGTQLEKAVSGRGKVVPPGDSAALAFAIDEYAADANTRADCAARAREYAVATLSRTFILNRLIAFLKGSVPAKDKDDLKELAKDAKNTE